MCRIALPLTMLAVITRLICASVCRGASKAVFAERFREFLSDANKDAEKKIERPVFTGNFPFKLGKFTISSLRQVRL